MPTDAKPLFRADALRPKLNAFALPSAAANAKSTLGKWNELLSSNAAERMKETELLPDFLSEIFGSLLGYAGPASGAPVYTLKRESLVQVDEPAERKLVRAVQRRRPEIFVHVGIIQGRNDEILVSAGRRDHVIRSHAAAGVVESRQRV